MRRAQMRAGDGVGKGEGEGKEKGEWKELSYRKPLDTHKVNYA